MIENAVRRAYQVMKERNWDSIYWAIDLHSTCIKSNYVNGEYEWINKDAKKCLQYISSLEESKIILWSSIYSKEILSVWDWFENQNIYVEDFNNNPYVNNTKTGCFNKKFYFSILLDDKAGFEPDTDWKVILETLKSIKE